ncbi:MAG: ABC transporter permease [Gaiellaceae bacterium MAG52_C11]|nr:ABC transporter permease [Candidatus Gaiellasilicea maunaloa]
MKLALLHARAATLELLRLPAYIIPTLAFPMLFFLVFAAPHVKAEEADVAAALFAGFAVLGVALFQFGVGIANERISPWEVYLRTLPVEPVVRFGGRVLSAALFGTAAAAAVVVVALLVTPASLPVWRWGALAVALLLGGAPFALLGIALGYLATPRGALPIANLVYLGLSYCGGLWTTPDDLPDPVAQISPYLPTRGFADALTGVVIGQPWRWRAWSMLAIYTAVFAAVAVWGYRRDEGQRFR